VTCRTTTRFVLLAGLLLPRLARAQEEGPGGVPDSIAVIGARRVQPAVILQTAGLVPGRRVTYRDIQRAIQAVFATGQFDDVRVEQDTANGKQTIVVRVRERPLLIKWTVRGVVRLSEGSVKGKVQLSEGRALDPAAVARARGRIDSLYHAQGYYLARVQVKQVYEADSQAVRVIFDVDEERRVAIARVSVDGNEAFTDDQLVSHMETRPEGFWWFESGEFSDEHLRGDMQEKLPGFYGSHGYVDFQVMGDTLLVNDSTGKAELVVRVREGRPYRVGNFEIVGNRRFSTSELDDLFPFSGGGGILGLGGPAKPGEVVAFNQEKWDDATNRLRTKYYNEGYIYVQIRSDVTRRAGPDGGPVVDLRWMINEGQPAIVNRIEIVGNDVTHERVIRDAIVLLPGDVFRQDALIRSYQNISNLGFFNQPLPFPDTKPANDQGDVDVVFHVQEKHTGTVNFGASVGQGTGVGGFLGLEEPNLFGQGKHGRIQWQFGKNINDIDLSYTDPAIQESRISGTISVHNTRARYTVADLGQIKRLGGQLQFGFPAFHDHYTRLFVSYAIDQQTYTGSPTNTTGFNTVFNCFKCLRSTVGVTVLRDTRTDLPFATGGTMNSVGLSQSGGILGGDGDFQRIDLESRWYAPLGQMGGAGGGQPIKFVLGMTARSGFVFGYTPFFDQLFAMGGTQFGIPLRGYDEFSITPFGFDPLVTTTGAAPTSFGKSFLLMTSEVGVRISQMFYVNSFIDAGNLWANATSFDPNRLFRGAGFGLQVISPLGPLGIDVAYGFDKVPPGWKVHFRLGNFF